MFILIKPIRSPGDEPFLSPPPYDPRTGENLPGVPLHEIVIRPRIRKGEKKDIVFDLEKMGDSERKRLVGKMSKKDLEKLVEELFKRLT